ncbi:oligosaccharide flippase family protein [Phenylobacterium sp. LjRoot225]|uniref:oligosaccharide flippase family protein n=1 Tax=Phenylobacterium sp. LjRoot225 TaxID=3342285 RepID=UPI003ED114EE
MSTSKSPRSAAWVVADTGGVTLLSMATMLLMARAMGPADFGAAALAIGLIQVVNLYAEGLLHDALIQKQDTDDQAFSQAFWFVLRLGLVMAAAAAAAAFVLRDTPVGLVAKLSALAAISLPFSGMVGVMNARLRRGFDYRVVAIPSVGSKVLGSLIGLTLAFSGLAAWSLVIQYVCGFVLQAGGLLLAGGWRPSLAFGAKALRPLWRFALPMAFMHTLVGARLQAFTTLVAVWGGLPTAGVINMAFRLTVTPQTVLNTAIGNIGLPLLARNQGDREELAAAFRSFSHFVAIGLTPVFLGLAACADTLVDVLLGERWAASAGPVRLMAIAAALYLLRLPSSMLLRALGRVRYSVANAVTHLIITLGLMALVQPHSPMLASLLWCAPLVPLIPATLYVVRRETGLSYVAQLADVLPAVVAAAVMALCAAGLARLQGIGVPAPVTLAAQISAGGVIYAALLLLLDRRARELAVRQLAARLPGAFRRDPT